MRPHIEQSNGLATLPPFRSWLDCTINTSGYDFRKGQERTAAVLEETLYLAIARPDMQITNMPLAISVDAHWGDYAFAP